MDLGTDLKIARERAGFSLSELAARTRIPQQSLRAIEENDFAAVPPGIFVRSFIRNYAREVGVDPAEAIAQYRSMTEPVVEHDDAPSSEVVDQQIQSRPFVPDFSESRPVWGYALIAAALLIGLISVNRYASQNQSEVLAADPSVGTDTSAAAAIPVATTGAGIHIQMRAQGACWVRAVVDGQLVFSRLMQPGERETLTGQRDITLRIGDPAALSYSINGRSGQPLGAANQPVTVRFDTSGRATRVS